MNYRAKTAAIAFLLLFGMVTGVGVAEETSNRERLRVGLASLRLAGDVGFRCRKDQRHTEGMRRSRS